MAKMTSNGVKLLLNPIHENLQKNVDASDLATFFNLAREIKDLDNSAYLICGVCVDKTVVHQQIILKWAKGEYLFWVPTHCDYYTQFRQIFEPEFIPVAVGDTFTDEQGNKFRVSRLNQCHKKEIAGEYAYQGYTLLNRLQMALKGASTFAKGVKDDYPKMLSGIALHFIDTDLYVYGGSSCQMYCSDVIRMETVNEGQHMAVISQKDAKHILSFGQDTPISIHLTDTQMVVVYTELKKEITYDLLGSSEISKDYPVYYDVVNFISSVDAEGKMTFNSKQATNSIKQMLPLCNKVTSRVKMHLNGSIEMSAFDMDFSREGIVTMPYIAKDFPDTDIVVNGKHMVTALGYFKGETTIYSNGDGLKPIILKGSFPGQVIMATMSN